MKLVIVTGGTRGLGLTIVKRLLRDGYRVVAIGRKLSEELSLLINEQSEKDTLHFIEFDLGQIDSLKDLAKRIYHEFGPIYALVNNAAIGLDGVLGTMHESQIGEVLKVNLHSPIILTKYVSRYMLLHGEGRILNISSIIATTGFNGLSVYAASKSGLIGFTRSLSRELGRGNITVNSVSPGYLTTDMTTGLAGEKLESIKRRSALGCLADIDDVAGTVAFLLSTDAKSITGSNVVVDAGSTA